MPQSAPVIIYDTSLNKVAYLPLAFDIAYELRANEVGRAWFSIPLDDPHLSEVTELRFAEVYDGLQRVEMFRIIKSWKSRDGSQEGWRFECEHVLATLMDDQFDDTFYAGAPAGTSQAITDILAEQGTGRWTKGTVAFSESYLYEWGRGVSLLKALLDLPKRFQKGYFWTFDTTSYPWTINLIAPPASVTAYIDYGRNLQSISRETDMTGLVTKLYAWGAGAGADQIDITSEEPSGHEYIANNTGTYGTIVHHWTDQRYDTAAELYAAAQEKLAVISEPRYVYKIDAADLYHLTQESIDSFSIGTLVTVADEGMDIDVDVRVMGITKSDVTGSPGDVKFVLANKGEEFDFDERLKSNDLSGVTITNIPGGPIGGLPGTPSDPGLYVTSAYLGYHDGTNWKTYMDMYGRLYAQHDDCYFRFDPVLGTLDIKAAITITGGSGIGNLTDTGALALLNVVGTAQIDNLAVTNAKIANCAIDKLTTGTLDAVTVTLAETTGSAIRQGKSSPTDTDAGFWLGWSAGASMFSIGDASYYLKWTGTELVVKGSITGTISADLNMDNHALYNCVDLRGGAAGTVNVLNLDTNQWIGQSTATYLLLNDTGSLRYATQGTIFSGGALYLESTGRTYLDSGEYISIEVAASPNPMLITDFDPAGGDYSKGWIKVYMSDGLYHYLDFKRTTA